MSKGQITALCSDNFTLFDHFYLIFVNLTLVYSIFVYSTFFIRPLFIRSTFNRFLFIRPSGIRPFMLDLCLFDLSLFDLCLFDLVTQFGIVYQQKIKRLQKKIKRHSKQIFIGTSIVLSFSLFLQTIKNPTLLIQLIFYVIIIIVRKKTRCANQR